MKYFGALMAASAVALAATTGHAESTAWISANGGTSFFTMSESDVKVRASLAFDAGVGSAPAEPFIVGGVFRVAPIIGEGTDLLFLGRGAMGDFQTGWFGVAVDLGGYLRTFGAGAPSGGFAGAVLLGGPIGLQLTLSGHAGTEAAYGGSATLGIDLLRLTVYRQTLLEWWPNPGSPGAPPASRDR